VLADRVHLCVQRPDGALVDAYGVYVCEPFADIAARCGESTSGWTEADAANWCAQLSDDDQREVDEDLRHPWFQKIFPASDRLSQPLRYDEDDDAV
jgi:hypothetical protein